MSVDYDAVTQAPFPSAPGEFHTTLFPVGDEMVFDAAGQLVQKLKSRHYYTDTATFDLRYVERSARATLFTPKGAVSARLGSKAKRGQESTRSRRAVSV